MAQWRGYKVKKLAVSAGFAAKRDHPDISLFDLAKIADEQMYLTKERYYQKRGIDRRGQQEALKAVTSLYIEIVKINITKDSYKLIQSSRDQFIDEVENYEHISDCFRAYGESDDMYSEDKEQFFAMTDIDFLRRKFAEGAQTFMIQFRRLSSDGTIKTVILELVRSEQYTDEEQILFLFIKCVC